MVKWSRIPGLEDGENVMISDVENYRLVNGKNKNTCTVFTGGEKVLVDINCLILY